MNEALSFFIFQRAMPSEFVLISDSMAKTVSLPQTDVHSFSGARPNDERVRRFIRNMRVGDNQQAILFLGGKALKQWKNQPARSPAMVIHL